MSRPVVTLAVSMTFIKDKKKVASRVGETKKPHQPKPVRISCYEVYYSTEWLYLTATTVALCALFISPKGKACGLKDEHPASLILKDQRGVIL